MQNDLLTEFNKLIQKAQKVFKEVTITDTSATVAIDDLNIRLFIVNDGKAYITVSSIFSPPEAEPYFGVEILYVNFDKDIVNLGNVFGSKPCSVKYKMLLDAFLALI